MIYRPRAQPTEAATPEELGVFPETAAVTWNGQTRKLEKRRTVIGRSKDCDIQLEDSNVSRRHAELRQEGTSYWIVDLDSTNGVEVNGRRLKRAKLEHGDRMTLGSTELTFEREV
jgi:pSer/pThr/pTyr-binding forkhead associated (FHA) protein